MQIILEILSSLESLLWNYIGLFLILSIGIYLTIKHKFFQLKILFQPRKYIGELLSCAQKGKQGIHPIKLYFSSIGGMVGLGNLVAVVTVITVGGPGGILWMWLASFIGMIVKYSEIYLGIKYRVKTKTGYDGGPMYFLQAAFKGSKLKLDKILPAVMCILLCIYGVEISQFLILTDTFVSVLKFDRMTVILILLALVIISSVNGVKRLSSICSILMPPFMISYILLGFWIMAINYVLLPEIFSTIFSDAFSFKASATGAIGGNILIAAHNGISRAVYSGDIGIGYDSTVQSETQTTHPEKQARIAIFALFSDTLICTITLLILLISGVHNMQMEPSKYLVHAISDYIPHSQLYVSCMFFVAGFTTLVGYFVVGQKCAIFLNKKVGRTIYIVYAIVAFVFFGFQGQADAMLVMSVSGGLLMSINLIGVFLLRKEVKFVC